MVKMFGLATLLMFLATVSAWTLGDIFRHLDVCRMQPKYGDCGARTRMWYFNFKKQTCERFIYSTCGGNSNRFYDRHECMEYCRISK